MSNLGASKNKHWEATEKMSSYRISCEYKKSDSMEIKYNFSLPKLVAYKYRWLFKPHIPNDQKALFRHVLHFRLLFFVVMMDFSNIYVPSEQHWFEFFIMLHCVGKSKMFGLPTYRLDVDQLEILYAKRAHGDKRSKYV